MRQLNAAWLAVGFLVFIIALNVIFDTLGTAATAASEAPLNAMAARKIVGAQEALVLVKNADKVANFTNDVIGDIAGTIAGALGISLMAQVVLWGSGVKGLWLNILVTAVIASVTVTGKAIGKRVAVTRPNQVVLLAGRLIAGFSRVIKPFNIKNGKYRKKNGKNFNKKKVRRVGRSGLR
ncbi:MAG: CNNM domain-containing protein [Bacillota bacterium]